MRILRRNPAGYFYTHYYWKMDQYYSQRSGLHKVDIENGGEIPRRSADQGLSTSPYAYVSPCELRPSVRTRFLKIRKIMPPV